MYIGNTSFNFFIKLTNKVNIFKITSVQSYIFCSHTNHNWGSTWGLQKNNLPVVFPFCEPLCSSYTCTNKLTDNKGAFYLYYVPCNKWIYQVKCSLLAKEKSHWDKINCDYIAHITRLNKQDKQKHTIFSTRFRNDHIDFSNNINL